MTIIPKSAVAAMASLCAMLAPAPALGAEAGALPPLVVLGLRTVDMAGEQPAIAGDVALLIADGEIRYAGPAVGLPKAEGARVVDATGLTALPGLTDMHVHVWDEAELNAYLASGVTTVRNMSGMPFHLELARRIEAGELAGPRLLTTGPILNSAGPNQQINHQLVETADEARAAVAWQQEAGFTRLKLYSNIRREPLEAVLEEAAARGLKVTGHPPEGFRAEGVPFEKPFAIAFDEVLNDHFETVEHSESIVWHGLYDRHDEAEARALAKRIAASGTAVTPTLLAYENLVRMAETKGEFAKRPGTGMLNPLVTQTETAMFERWSKEDPKWPRDHATFIGRFTAMMQEEGVTLVSGSDAGIFTNIPGESLLDELELLVRTGLSPFEALQSSTRNVAQVLGEESLSGCLGAGCRADLVLYACNPLEAISCTRTPIAVVRAGRWYNRAALDAMLQAAQVHDPERTGRNLVAGMAAQGTPIDPAMLGLE